MNLKNLFAIVIFLASSHASSVPPEVERVLRIINLQGEWKLDARTKTRDLFKLKTSGVVYDLVCDGVGFSIMIDLRKEYLPYTTDETLEPTSQQKEFLIEEIRQVASLYAFDFTEPVIRITGHTSIDAYEVRVRRKYKEYAIEPDGIFIHTDSKLNFLSLSVHLVGKTPEIVPIRFSKDDLKEKADRLALEHLHVLVPDAKNELRLDGVELSIFQKLMSKPYLIDLVKADLDDRSLLYQFTYSIVGKIPSNKAAGRFYSFHYIYLYFSPETGEFLGWVYTF
ncbi:MAG: hypothetical protein GC154_17100 [bacterium]|nr:hypothetical protein [bacterium]